MLNELSFKTLCQVKLYSPDDQKTRKVCSGRQNSDASASSAESNVLWRSWEDRNLHPHSLNMDRKRLSRCVRLKHEPDIEMVNYQHNKITKIEFLSAFKQLVFLDFYDNRIEAISGLFGLASLRVLMLGKNLIRRISGLEQLSKLDVLDLHSNNIDKVENLETLTNLRVLNLSGNQISRVENIKNVHMLEELNLKRNKIRSLTEVTDLPHLQRLLLSNNEICRDDGLMEILMGCSALAELTLNDNPICQESQYKTTILKCLPQLKQLDMRTITDLERTIVQKAVQKEAELRKQADRKAIIDEERSNRIQAAQAAWEANHLQASDQTVFRQQTEFEFKTEPTILFGSVKPERLDEQGYAELNGSILKFYGKDSLMALDKAWGYQVMSSVLEVKFKFIDIEKITHILLKLKLKFPRAEVLILSHTNIRNYHQIHKLEVLKRLKELVIVPKGNPITSFSLWREYVFFKLSKSLKLQLLNGEKIDDEALTKATELFNPVQEIIGSLNDSMRLIALHRSGNATNTKKITMETVNHMSASEFYNKVTASSMQNTSLKVPKVAEDLLQSCKKGGAKEVELKQRMEAWWPSIYQEYCKDMHDDIAKSSTSADYLTRRLKAFDLWMRKNEQKAVDDGDR